MTTNMLTEQVVFNLNRALEMLDTLSSAVNKGIGAIDTAPLDPETPDSTKASRQLEGAQYSFIRQARNQVRGGKEWIQAMQDNSQTMLRFQRYVDPYLDVGGLAEFGL